MRSGAVGSDRPRAACVRARVSQLFVFSHTPATRATQSHCQPWPPCQRASRQRLLWRALQELSCRTRRHCAAYHSMSPDASETRPTHTRVYRAHSHTRAQSLEFLPHETRACRKDFTPRAYHSNIHGHTQRNKHALAHVHNTHIYYTHTLTNTLTRIHAARTCGRGVVWEYGGETMSLDELTSMRASHTHKPWHRSTIAAQFGYCM